MKGKLLAALLLSIIGSRAGAQAVALAELGAFELEFAPALAAASYPGPEVAGEVTFRQGEAYGVPSPGRVQQIEFLLEPGSRVSRGQPFATLRGPEMHHFEMAYESSGALLEGARRRFESNRSLYENKSISESRWLEISEKYYALSLEYEHMRHFFELVLPDDGDPDALTLVAPLTGTIDYRTGRGGVQEGERIAVFIPDAAIRVRASIPNGLRGEVQALGIGSCELGVDRSSAVSDGFFVHVWSDPLIPACEVLLGQQLPVTPLLRAPGSYAIPRAAVFQMGRDTLVLMRDNERLLPVAVTLLGTRNGDYVLRAESSLDGRQVLVSSVSAVQGLLLGLGSE
jgi:hypothetical protein